MEHTARVGNQAPRAAQARPRQERRRPSRPRRQHGRRHGGGRADGVDREVAGGTAGQRPASLPAAAVPVADGTVDAAACRGEGVVEGGRAEGARAVGGGGRGGGR